MSNPIPQVAKTDMMIRKPISEVFNAFINPEITTEFWFTQSTGKLEEGARVDWTWDMYDLTVPVTVKSIIPNESIQVEWGTGEHRSTVDWTFRSLDDSKTFVTIINSNFQGTEDEIIAKVIDSTGGFTMVLAGLKARLEHGIRLNLIGDKYPKELHIS